VSAGRFFEMKFEDLVADPLGKLEELYRELDLGDFALVRPYVSEYLAAQKDYRPNLHKVTDEVRSRVGRYWGDVVNTYGYSERSPKMDSPAVTSPFPNGQLGRESGQLARDIA
jgi:omega-hydroxy-beta-dihydromenaquinone-9 sulfotransferase